MEGGTPGVGKEELFAQLDAGHAAGVTVVTPNRRLALALQREFGDRQVARGVAVWETPDILPLPAFIERLWSDALHSERGAAVPGLLTDFQEQALWEECIRASKIALLSVPAAAAQCREAWKLVHAWSLRERLEGAAGHDDAKTFVTWLHRYEKATRERRCTDGARLPDAVKPLLGRGAVRLPASLVAFGFDLVTPQQAAFFEALGAARVAVSRSHSAPRESQGMRLAFSSSREELAACARWTRARLEAGARSIGVVVPDLARRRSAVARALGDILVPGARLPGAPRVPMPFELSMGRPLDAYPVVHDALLLLRACGPEVEFDAISRVIRSPFIAGAESEMGARALLDAELRKRASAKLTLESLRRLMALGSLPRVPLLEARLVRLADFHRRNALGARTPSAWAHAFMEALDIAGFPGERGLDSDEYQALQKWHEAIAELATLDRVVRRMGYREAWTRLAERARDTLFQPQGSQAPVQVLGVLESAGLQFDHLWVLGLTDEAWPLAERAHAFVPLRLQREAGIPQADPGASLEIDRRLTQGWLASAGEVVLSHPVAESDRELFMSPLIRAVPEGRFEDLGVPAHEGLAQAIRRGATLEQIDDRRAPPIATAAQQGGTSLFRDHAACPFRAFARYRLASRALESPAPGLDARDRGKLLHTALATVWEALGDKAHLDAQTLAERDALLARAADEAIARLRRSRPDALGGRFGEIERARLISHLGEWLAFEAQRADFSVVANERKAPLAFGGVEVQARLDRMDALGHGAHAVIDYKTGEAKVAQWLGDRPEEPQLPMYALGAPERVEAVVFAHVKAGNFCFSGVGSAEGMLPGVTTIAKNRSRLARQYPDWPALVAGWRASLERIGESYARGDADVDPKNGPATCELCDQRTFCRVSERLPVGPGTEGGDEP